jgi:hypothetical protein
VLGCYIQGEGNWTCVSFLWLITLYWIREADVHQRYSSWQQYFFVYQQFLLATLEFFIPWVGQVLSPSEDKPPTPASPIGVAVLAKGCLSVFWLCGKQSQRWDLCKQNLCLHTFKNCCIIITLQEGCSSGSPVAHAKLSALQQWTADRLVQNFNYILTSGSNSTVILSWWDLFLATMGRALSPRLSQAPASCISLAHHSWLTRSPFSYKNGQLNQVSFACGSFLTWVLHQDLSLLYNYLRRHSLAFLSTADSCARSVVSPKPLIGPKAFEAVANAIAFSWLYHSEVVSVSPRSARQLPGWSRLACFSVSCIIFSAHFQYLTLLSWLPEALPPPLSL